LTGDSLGKQVLSSVENNQALARGAGEAVENQKNIIIGAQADSFKSMQNAIDISVRSFQRAYDSILRTLSPFENSISTILENVKHYMKQILSATWDFLKREVLEPANKYIKDNFGIDIKKAIEPVIEKFSQLATEAYKLWQSMGGLNGIIKTIIEYFPSLAKGAGAGAVAGGVAGAFLTRTPGGAIKGAEYGSMAGAAVGAGVHYVGKKVEELEIGKKVDEFADSVHAWTYKKQQEYLPEWMLKRMGGEKKPAATPTGGSTPKPTGPPSIPPATPNKTDTTSTGLLKGDTSGLDSELKKRLMDAAEIYGKPLTITSGFRSYDKQKELYDESVRAGRPGTGPTGMLVAKPGFSAHEKGMAVDIQEGKTDPKAVAALRYQGLLQLYKENDPVHFEMSNLSLEDSRRLDNKERRFSALMQTASAKPSNYQISTPESVADSNPSSKSVTSTSTQSSLATGTSMAPSEETYARMFYDIKDSITTKMQEMIDKVAESNDLLGKIMRHST
jgi:hypothetical protein